MDDDIFADLLAGTNIAKTPPPKADPPSLKDTATASTPPDLITKRLYDIAPHSRTVSVIDDVKEDLPPTFQPPTVEREPMIVISKADLSELVKITVQESVQSTVIGVVKSLRSVLEDMSRRIDATTAVPPPQNNLKGLEKLEESIQDLAANMHARFTTLDMSVREAERGIQALRDKHELFDAQSKLAQLSAQVEACEKHRKAEVKAEAARDEAPIPAPTPTPLPSEPPTPVAQPPPTPVAQPPAGPPVGAPSVVGLPAVTPQFSQPPQANYTQSPPASAQLPLPQPTMIAPTLPPAAAPQGPPTAPQAPQAHYSPPPGSVPFQPPPNPHYPQYQPPPFSSPPADPYAPPQFSYPPPGGQQAPPQPQPASAPQPPPSFQPPQGPPPQMTAPPAPMPQPHIQQHLPPPPAPMPPPPVPEHIHAAMMGPPPPPPQLPPSGPNYGPAVPRYPQPPSLPTMPPSYGQPFSRPPPQLPPPEAHQGPPRTSTTDVPLDQITADISSMGFERSKVLGVVADLQRNGQSVDLNVILDRLMNERMNSKY